MYRFTILLTSLLMVAGTTSVRGQDIDEVKRLKERIELLETKLKLSEKENELFKKEVELLKADAGKKQVAKPAAENDTFAEGAILSGKRTMTRGDDSWQQTMVLIVTKRDGTSFEGELTITNVPTAANHMNSESTRLIVTGTAAVGNGAVNFVTEKQGEFQQKFSGKCNSGEFSFECAGKGSMGNAVSGVGVIRPEEERSGAKAKAKLGDDVEYELIKCVRDPKKLNQVEFTFCLKSEAGNRMHMAPHQLSLTDSEGAAINAKVVSSPRLQGDFMGTQRLIFNLPKGQEVRFQVSVTGIKEDVTSIQRVELTGPPRGFVTDRVTFTNVKVGTKK